MASIEPEIWVEGAGAAVAFYHAAFGAVVLHRAGQGNDIVAQLEIGTARFWVTEADAGLQRYSPSVIGGTTGRTLLVVEDPDALLQQAVQAGGTQIASLDENHGWRMGRIVDPFGHEWEIGRPIGPWPPAGDGTT